MNFQRFIAFIHKYLSLIIGVQILFWVVSGLFFAIFPIEQVRSEHRMKEIAPIAMNSEDFAALPKVLAENPNATKLRLESVLEGSRIFAELGKSPEGKPIKALFDGRSGVKLSPISAQTAQEIVLARMKENSAAGGIRPITKIENETSEYRGALPAWKVELIEPQNMAIYVSVDSGEITARRSNLWRVYDTLWALHIMDWQNHEDFNHPLIIISAILALLSTIAGIILIFYRVKFRKFPN